MSAGREGSMLTLLTRLQTEGCRISAETVVTELPEDVGRVVVILYKTRLSDSRCTRREDVVLVGRGTWNQEAGGS